MSDVVLECQSVSRWYGQVIGINTVDCRIGPGVTGLLIDAGIPFPEQGLAMALWCFAISAAFHLVTRRLARERLAD